MKRSHIQFAMLSCLAVAAVSASLLVVGTRREAAQNPSVGQTRALSKQKINDDIRRQQSSANTSHSRIVDVIVNPTTLEWSAMAGYQSPSPSPYDKSVGRIVKITHLSVPRPLDLKVYGTDTPLNLTASTGSPVANAPRVTKPYPDDISPPVDRHASTGDDPNLFNNYTGLRGFMAENWLNKSVGIQGGLAIPKEQLRNDQEDLQDQMAVGMGVLFAF